MPAPGRLLLLTLLLAPLASAQQPTARIDIVATPTGGWDSDGFLAATGETAMWRVNATATFSSTAACPNGDVEVRLELLDAAQTTDTRGVAPAATPVAIPQGGGSRSVEATATATVPSSARGGEAIQLRLHGTLTACSGLGTSPKAEANATLTLTPLLRPLIEVVYDNRSANGTFSFDVTNAGNGPLSLSAVATPLQGSPDQPVDPVSGLAVDPGEFTTFTVRFPDKVPGIYAVRIEAVFNGANPEQHPKGAFEAQVEIPAPIVVRETKGGTPGASILLLAAALLLAARLRR